MYKHIIWDFDGTLFDSYPTMALAFKAALEEEGIHESSDKIMGLMKVSVPHLFDYYIRNYKVSDRLGPNFERYREELEADNIRPFLNVEEICRRIYQSKRTNHLYTHRGKSSIEFLKKYGMYEYFSGFITKENDFKRKPDPEALLFLINEYKMDKSEALMIGDRDIDILAAKNAGIAACYYKDNQIHDCETADYTITDYDQLSKIIGI